MRYLLAALAVAVPGTALSQTIPDSPQNITVTATRVPSQAENIASGVTIIDRATIEQRGYTSLVDALSAVPGLRVAQSGGPGSQASVFIRGTNSNQVLVLRDGVPINDPADPGSAFNFGDDTLNDIERIEIIRGPMSSLYGSGAMGGVINLISRRGAGRLHGSLTLAAGLPRQGLARGDVAGGSGIWDFSANAEGQSLLGFDQTPQRESGVYTGERDGDHDKQAEAEIGVTPIAGTRISLLLRARDAKSGYDEQGQVTYDGGNASAYDAALFGRLGLTSTLFNGDWTTSAYLSRLQDDRRYTVTATPADPNDDSADDRYHGRRTDFQWNNIVTLPDEGPATDTKLVFGYQHDSDQANSGIEEVFGGYPYDSQVKAHDDIDSGMLGLQTLLFGRLAADGQIREDGTTVSGDAFTWRMGGSLDLSEILSHVKASYGTSFRAPALFDRYGIDSYGYRGNPDLLPERGQGWEAGWVTDIPVSGKRDAISLGITYFDNRIRDLIETVFVPVYTAVNIDRARTHGVEAVLTLRMESWLQADLSYTYTDARNLGTGSQLLRRPYDQGAVNLRISPIPAIVIAPELLYTGAFQDYLTNDLGAPLSAPGLSPSGLIFNVNVSWQVTPRVQIFAWGKNLADSRFEPVAGFQTPGASFLAGSKLSF
jgi:vitamin B12 transporter